MRNKPNKSELSRWLQTTGLERQQTKRSKCSSPGCTSRSAFQIRSLLLKPLPCILGRKRKQNKPWNSVIPFNPMLGTPYLPPFPLTHSILGSPDRQAAGGGWDTGAPLLLPVCRTLSMLQIPHQPGFKGKKASLKAD